MSILQHFLLLVFPSVTMDHPSVQLLYFAWSRGTVRWKTTHGTSSIWNALCSLPGLLYVFYITSLRKWSMARLPADSPKDYFAAMVSNNSPFTIGPTEDDIATSPTPAQPESSHPPPMSDSMETLYVPTADHGDRPVAMDKPEPKKRSEGVIARSQYHC